MEQLACYSLVKISGTKTSDFPIKRNPTQKRNEVQKCIPLT